MAFPKESSYKYCGGILIEDILRLKRELDWRGITLDTLINLLKEIKEEEVNNVSP